MITLLLGAEGCSETEDQDWIREATPKEAQTFGEEFAAKNPLTDLRDIWIDRTGRPYFLMVILEHAPEEIKKQASLVLRTLRLMP